MIPISTYIEIIFLMIIIEIILMIDKNIKDKIKIKQDQEYKYILKEGKTYDK